MKTLPFPREKKKKYSVVKTIAPKTTVCLSVYNLCKARQAMSLRTVLETGPTLT